MAGGVEYFAGLIGSCHSIGTLGVVEAVVFEQLPQLHLRKSNVLQQVGADGDPVFFFSYK